MERRDFIKILSRYVLASYGLMLCPSIALASDSDELAFQGQERLNSKKYAEAVDLLKKALEMDPGNHWAYGLLGRAYTGLDKRGEAVAAFRKAVNINPEDTFSRMMIDQLTQKPIPKTQQKKKAPPGPEQKARQEEAAALNRISSDSGLGYKVERVVIDAGHGGFDSGAVGLRGLKEKDLTLDIALRLHERLKSEGKIKTFLTRTGDYYVPLSERTVIANQHNADLFISIHVNASTNRASSGSETYYCSAKASSKEAMKVAELENSVLKYDEGFKQKAGFFDFEKILRQIEQRLYWRESGKFASIFQGRFKQYLPIKNRGVHSANFYVLRTAKMPAILLEAGFVSNLDEEMMLYRPDFRARIVEAIARGLV